MIKAYPSIFMLMMTTAFGTSQSFGQSRLAKELSPQFVIRPAIEISRGERAIDRLNHRLELGLYAGGGSRANTRHSTDGVARESIIKLDQNRFPRNSWISGLVAQEGGPVTQRLQYRDRRNTDEGSRRNEAHEHSNHEHSNHEHGDHNHGNHNHGNHEHGNHDDHLVPHHFQLEQIRALHESAERLDGVGMPDLAHELHQRAEQIEREIHRAQEPRPEQILMELMENMQLLRREVREVNERLDRVMDPFEHKGPPIRRDNDSQSQRPFPKARRDSDLRETNEHGDRNQP